MEIGESVAVVVQMMAEDKCVICGKKHAEPKEEEIKETAPGKSGWKRKSMSGVFESDGTREKVYPLSTFPPPYSYQGHHCLGLSALVEGGNGDSPKDRRIRFNFFLDQIGYFPNRPRNCIGLPARRGYGDFKAFHQSLDADKPLQMHGPGHDEAYFAQCDNLLSVMLSVLTNPKKCEKTTSDEWRDKLKKLMEQAENFAFKRLAASEGGWRLHPAEQVAALALYFLPTSKSMEVNSTGGSTERRSGLGRPQRNIEFPNLSFDTGPFGK
jgi:hypothetical protein